MRQSGEVTEPFPLEFARSLAKAELHVHLEGTVDSATVLSLCERHGVAPPADDVDGVDDWYRFDNFDDFLVRYLAVLGLLRTPDDFALAAERYVERAHEHGVVHVELHVSACGHIIENQRTWAPIHEAIVSGCRAAAQATGVSWGLIPDISPHLGAAACEVAIDEVLAGSLDGIVAIGMGGPADNWRTQDFGRIFDKAAASGLHRVSHAGEFGRSWEVKHAIEQFGAERIRHGIGAINDPAVVEMLVERGIACDVCPGSNLALKSVPDAASHPLRRMLEAGITVTLGSDDPPMFQTTLLDEYRRAWEWCELDRNGLEQLATNSLRSSFTAAR
jgi:aminodeoxyfutalosine deaminase